MPPFVTTTAVIELRFDPIVSLGDWNVRLETIALAVVVFSCLGLAALIARATPVDTGRPPDAMAPGPDEPNRLRADDLLYLAVAALPGAVAGGRLGYALLHLDYYQANPAALLDVTQGSFELSLAVVGGVVTAGIVAALLGTPVRRWMHASTLPLLLALAAGKAAMVLGGDGQGQPFDGSWATSYPGPGPWGSLAPSLPSHPSQAYEALATTGVLLVMLALLSMGAFRRRDGRAFLLGLGLWAAARAVVATTWRDASAVGSLNAGQVIAGGVAIVALAMLLGSTFLSRARPGASGASPRAGTGALEPDWPDPATRPRF